MGQTKGVHDRWTEVLDFANQIFSWQNAQSDVKFTDYIEGFSEVSIYNVEFCCVDSI